MPHLPAAEPVPVIGPEALTEAIAYCEGISLEEMAGRSESWPSTAAVAYWQNAQTLRRLLAALNRP